METGRGKKGKKAGWHLTLGLKDAIFAGIGVVGLLMMSFALGALAGRGDIYRVAYSWGLLSPEAKQLVQMTPLMAPAPASPVARPRRRFRRHPRRRTNSGRGALSGGSPGNRQRRRQVTPPGAGCRLHGPAAAAGHGRLKQKESQSRPDPARAEGPG